MKQEILSKTIVTVLSTLVVASIWWIWSCLKPGLAGTFPTVTGAVSLGWQTTCSAAQWLVGPVAVPAWLFLALLGTTVGLVARAMYEWIRKRRQTQGPNVIPLYLAFTEFRRFGLVWRWAWAGQRISCVNAFCPDCDRRIRYDEDLSPHSTRPTILYCSNCASVRVERPGKMPDIKSEVTLEIEHAVRTGQWRHQLPTRSPAQRAA